MDILNVQNISIQYGNDPPCVTGVSFDMTEGKIVGIVGESGSGKTTVVRAILGLLPGGGRISEGRVLFNGEDMATYSESRWRDVRGSGISMIFQDSGAMINPIRTIGSQYIEYIKIHRPDMSKADAYALAVDTLTKMRLPDGDNIMKSYTYQLSGGMRQRVGIALAMTFEPKLLLADEPTSAIDVTIQAQIVRQMMELRERFSTSIVLVTHNIGVAAYMSDEMIVMQYGKVMDRGDRDTVLNHAESEYTRQLLQAVPEIGGKRYV